MAPPQGYRSAVDPADPTALPDDAIVPDETEVPSLIDTLPEPGDGDDWEVKPAGGAAPEPLKERPMAAPSAPPLPEEMAAWATLNDVKPDQFPEAMRPHVGKMMELARTHAATVDASKLDADRAKIAYEARTADLDRLVGELREKGAPGVGAQAAYVLELQSYARDRGDEAASAQWRAFNAEHPYFMGLPDSVKKAWADMVEKGAHDHFPGDHVIDKLGALLRFVAHESGVILPAKGAAAPPKVAVSATAPSEKVLPASAVPAASTAHRQAVVTDGRAPPPTQRVAPWTRTVDDILDKHDHLLD